VTSGQGQEDRSVLTRPARPPDAVLRYGDLPDQVIDVRRPPRDGAPRPLVVVVHGGFWRPQFDRTNAGALSEGLADAGYVVATVEYRRGRWQDLVADVEAALDAAPTLVPSIAPSQVEPGRTVLVGHSAGGHLVLWYAARHPDVAGVVGLGAVCDLVAAERENLGDGAVRAFLAGPAEEHPDLDPARHPGSGVPVVLVHGEEDAIVPPTQAATFADGRADVVLDVVPGAGHFAVVDPTSAAWPRVLAAVGRVAGGVTTLP
jgi:acetyl esterase/lipase